MKKQNYEIYNHDMNFLHVSYDLLRAYYELINKNGCLNHERKPVFIYEIDRTIYECIKKLETIISILENSKENSEN